MGLQRRGLQPRGPQPEACNPEVCNPEACGPEACSPEACDTRLELLAGVVGGCGLGARGVPALGACDFVVPLCDSPSEKIRETAMGLLARLHALAPAEVLAHVTTLKPSLAQALTISAGPGAGGGSGAAGPLGPAA